jgi:hypothetical protein
LHIAQELLDVATVSLSLVLFIVQFGALGDRGPSPIYWALDRGRSQPMGDGDREQQKQAFEQVWQGWEELLRIGEDDGPARMGAAIDALPERGAKSMLKVVAATVLRQRSSDEEPKSPPT